MAIEFPVLAGEWVLGDSRSITVPKIEGLQEISELYVLFSGTQVRSQIVRCPLSAAGPCLPDGDANGLFLFADEELQFGTFAALNFEEFVPPTSQATSGLDVLLEGPVDIVVEFILIDGVCYPDDTCQEVAVPGVASVVSVELVAVPEPGRLACSICALMAVSGAVAVRRAGRARASIR